MLVTLLFAGGQAYAQTDLEQAEKIFLLLKEKKGDDIYTASNQSLKAALTAQQLGEIFTQLESGYGSFVSKTDWQTMEIQGVTIYYSDIKFQNESLRLLLAFDPDGKANTIRFISVPNTSQSLPEPIESGHQQREIAVVNGNFPYPGS